MMPPIGWEFDEFVEQHAGTITNALQVYVRTMREESEAALRAWEAVKDDPAKRSVQDASLITTSGLRHAGLMFADAAEKTEAALRAWEALIEPVEQPDDDEHVIELPDEREGSEQ